MLDNVQKLFETLKDLKIEYKLFNHKEVLSIEDINNLDYKFPGQYCKNLFLRNSKGDINYLVVLMDSKRADLKQLAREIGSSRLSFASEERLFKYLQLKPGSVTPFGLINDLNKEVVVLIDKDLVGLDEINFHPNINTATITVSFEALNRFLEWHGNKTYYVNI